MGTTETDPILPLELYGPEVSYFTGKLEAALRYAELPYRRFAASPVELAAHTGVAQVPGLKLADGRWMTDTTSILDWLDDRYPGVSLIPRDPVAAFLSRLVEDYADEWLWRPAMHYRWDYAEGAAHLSRVLADEIGRDLPIPGFAKRYLIRNRQRALFTTGDGVRRETWDAVERIYLDSLRQLSAIFSSRSYLLGDRPSLADFGFFGPMFRHFAMDPPSARIMRETAPAVFEWVARLWNARRSKTTGELLREVPEDWDPILESIGRSYLPFLCANAEAWKQGLERFDVEIAGAKYRGLRTARYRVRCLEELRRHYATLSEQDASAVETRLRANGCWEDLWRIPDLHSGLDPERRAPLAGAFGNAEGGSMTGVSSAAAERFHWWPRRIAHRLGRPD